MIKPIEKNIKTALGNCLADLVLKNAFIVNVFTSAIEVNDIAIVDDTIVGIGKYSGAEEIDCRGLYVAPGFIDSHVHIESSMVTPEIFSDIVIKKGVTTVIADPHEITNVLGVKGLEFMLTNSRNSLVDIFFMLPSCVPATPFEDNGAVFYQEQMKEFYSMDRVLGLGEVMDVPSTINCRSELMEKIHLLTGKKIDGHCPGLRSKDLNAYINCGISTDHECISPEEAIEKVNRGLYVMLREGSAARNLKKLLKAVNSKNYHRFLYCTDDRHIHHLIEEGSIDECIRLSISEGMDYITAITIATLNAAQCYELKDRGAIAPNYKADLVIFEDTARINIKAVIKNGIVVFEKNAVQYKEESISSINLDFVKADDFKVKDFKKKVNVIKIIPGAIETVKTYAEVYSENNIIKVVGDGSINKICSIERYINSGKKGIAYIQGFNLENCAIAQTIAHDSHNIIVVGDNDEDMAVAVNFLIKAEGGIAIASKGKIIEALKLPIGGLMTSDSPQLIVKKLKRMNDIVRTHGLKGDFDPFITLAFMALPVIPQIKITTRGLFDYEAFDFIDLYTK